MARKIGDAFVRVKPDTKGFGPESEKGLKAGLSGVMGRVGVAAGAVLATALTGVLAQSITAASDLGEAQSAVKQIFGDSAKEIERFAATADSALGQSKLSAINAANTFATFGKAAGLSGAKLVDFSTDLTGLASDLASFRNTSPEQAIEAIGAALRGESEPIRSYGVLLDEATLKAEAMSLGLVKASKDVDKIKAAQISANLAQKRYNEAVAEHGKNSEQARAAEAALIRSKSALQSATEGTIGPLTNQQKVLAAQSAIVKQTTDAQGDFARTSGGLANQQRILTAQWENAKASLGSALLPILLKVATALRDLIGWIQQNQSWLGPLTVAVGGLVAVLWAANTATKAWNATAAVMNALHIKSAARWVAHAAKVVAHTVAIAASRVATLAWAGVTKAAALAGALLNAVNLKAAATWAISAARIVAHTAALVAYRVASFAIRAATIAWTAVQWALNAALTANPIGIVIVAIAALVAGFIWAWKNVGWFRAFFINAWKGIQIIVKAVVGWIVGTAWPFLQRAWQGIVLGVQLVWRFITNAFRGIQIIVGTVVNWVVNFVRVRVNAIIAIFQLIGRIITIVRSAFARTNAAIAEKIAQAIAWVKALPGRFVAALSNLGNALWQKGRDLIQGFINGLKSMAGRVADALLSLLPGPLKKFASMLGLASPSKLFRRWGAWTAEGFALGVDSRASLVDAALARLVPTDFRQLFGALAPTAAAASTGRWHPADVDDLGRAIGKQITRGLQAFNTVQGRRADLNRRGGG